MKNQIYPCLWFDGQAKAAAEFYCCLFNNSKITVESPMVVNFELDGRKFMGLNGGPVFKINPSISIFVTCTTHNETEELSAKLSEGGSFLMPLNKYPWSEKYAWVKDKFGLTWQLMLGEIPTGTPKIIPSFLFSNEQFGKAKEAIEFYADLFPDSKVHEMKLYEAGEAQPKGYLKFGHFTLNNELFAAMDGPGNHEFSFNEAVSIVAACETQTEIDTYWAQLTEGGEESRCGWLKDRFGVSWQIIPSVIGGLMTEPEKAQRVMAAVMQMKKLDIEQLINA